MESAGILDQRRCTVALEAKNKAECLEELATLMAESGLKVSREALLAALREREALGSTGFEHGVAIPHARLPGDVPFALGVAVSPRGVDYDSSDGAPSTLFFVLVGPEESPQEYLRFLAHISRVGLNPTARDEIRGAPTRAALRASVEAYLTPVAPEPARSSGGRKLLIIVLYELRFLDDVVTLFLEHGIQGATITESTGVKNVLSNVPLFGDFLNFLGDRSESSRTIMAVVPEREIHPLVAELEQITGDLDTHTGAAVLAVDLWFSKGSLGVT